MIRTDRHQTFANGKLVAEEVVAVDVTAEVNAEQLRNSAAGAIAANRAYLAISSPTAAEVRQQLEQVTRQNQGLIRLVLGQLDATD